MQRESLHANKCSAIDGNGVITELEYVLEAWCDYQGFSECLDLENEHVQGQSTTLRTMLKEFVDNDQPPFDSLGQSN